MDYNEKLMHYTVTSLSFDGRENKIRIAVSVDARDPTAIKIAYVHILPRFRFCFIAIALSYI